MLTNFDRMVQLAEVIFNTREDPDQLDIDDEVLKRFSQIHPFAVAEYSVADGPVAWVLLLPTTQQLMNRFLNKEISEKELFEMTPLNTKYDALYLCSALVLEEYRRKGITKQLVVNSVNEILKDHDIQSLFFWSFSQEGDKATDSISKAFSLPIYKRINS